jgi:hypothetical protein
MRWPSHATVVSYLALFVALGTGGAYAVDRITGAQVENGTIGSADLKDRQAVAAVDVRRDTLTGGQIREGSLDVSSALPLAGVNDAGDCDPSGPNAIDCVATSIRLDRPARLMVIATGGMYSEGSSSPVRGACEVRLDGVARPTAVRPGETVDATSADSSDGFARTVVTGAPVPPGEHRISLSCGELDPDVRIATPTIAVLAVSAG